MIRDIVMVNPKKTSVDEVEVNGKTYVTVDALADRIGYNRDSLRKLAISAKVDAIRIGTSWLVNPLDLERYQSERKNRGPHEG